VIFLGDRIYTSKISSKGLMTLPKEIRTTLGIKEGDRVLLKVEPDGKITLEKAVIIPAQGGIVHDKN
jgi:AbrB family looped-hinge helix DNA binding protein